MNILCIGSHPDDIEFGCGGTVYKYNDVSFLILTNGNPDNPRILEQNKSCEVLGVNTVFIDNENDGFIKDDRYMVQKIQHYIKLCEPNIVITHYPNDSHQDHRNVSKAVKSAIGRNNISLIYFRSWSSIDFNPNLFINISDCAEQKRESLNCFTSQIDKYKNRELDFVEESFAYNQIYGMKSNCKYAEGFVIDKFFIN